MTAAEGRPAAIQILLVDDNADQRELTVEALRERLPEARVTEAGDGPAALQTLAGGGIDLVVLDYSLPGMNGLEVLQKINEQGCRTPVIMVTGQGDETIAVEAMKNGAQDYIIKIKNYHEALPIAIERILHQSRMKRDLEAASMRARRLYEISLAAAKERRVDVIAEGLVMGASRLIGTEAAVLYLVDPRGNIGVLKSVGVVPGEMAAQGPPQALGVLSMPFTTGQPVVIDDPAAHPLWSATPWLHALARQVLAVPLAMQGRIEGALCVINKRTREAFTPEDVDTLSTLAVHAGVAVDNARFVEKIEQQAVSDSLTGLYNHMEFQRCLAKELDRGRRYDSAVSLVLLDLDHFKLVNDTYGHQVGDTVLKEIARTLQEHLRSADKVFRYGGEEFAMILPETEKLGAKAISERICRTIAAASYAAGPSQSINVTASLGIASFPEDALLREEVIGSADQALYAAKHHGRNQVAVYSDVLCAMNGGAEVHLEDYLWHPQLAPLGEVGTALQLLRPPVSRSASAGVLIYVQRLCEVMQLDEGQRRELEYAALLAHIGQAAGGPGAQAPAGVQAAPALQALASQVAQLQAALQMVVYQSEHYDGTGPKGLSGDCIPLAARILSVAAAFHAMTAARAHPRLSRDAALARLREEAGGRFDPEVVYGLAAALAAADSRVHDPA